MKVLLLVTLGVVALANSTTLHMDEAWAKFKVDHGKQYQDIREEAVRKETFGKNLKRIEEHNQLYRQGLVEYYLKVNQYSDMTPEDMQKTLNGFRKAGDISDLIMTAYIPGDGLEVPDEIDWRKKGVVTEIKDQGNCGSCWSFSAVAALESQYSLKTGKLVTLSEQNLLDCSRAYSNKGCDGGDFTRAFIYVHENDGIDSEESYPYEGIDRDQCLYKDEYNVTSTPGLLLIEQKNEIHLKAAVGTVGPVSVAFNAGADTFMSYGGGIFYADHCPELDTNHAVLVVGYGSEDGEDYWIVKNSWGTSWGEDGYFRIARNRNNNCGIASWASFPLNY